MMYDGIEYHLVSENPDVLALIRRKDQVDGVSSQALGEYAYELGLRPPEGVDSEVVPAVVLVFPPDNVDGIYVWDTFEDEEPADEDYPVDENPWEGVVPTTQARRDR